MKSNQPCKRASQLQCPTPAVDVITCLLLCRTWCEWKMMNFFSASCCAMCSNKLLLQMMSSRTQAIQVYVIPIYILKLFIHFIFVWSLTMFIPCFMHIMFLTLLCVSEQMIFVRKNVPECIFFSIYLDTLMFTFNSILFMLCNTRVSVSKSITVSW